MKEKNERVEIITSGEDLQKLIDDLKNLKKLGYNKVITEFYDDGSIIGTFVYKGVKNGEK